MKAIVIYNTRSGNTQELAEKMKKVLEKNNHESEIYRDKEIKKLKAEHKVDFGSGYPSDPLTIDFTRKNFNKYPFFRKTWESYKNVAKKKAQKSRNISSFVNFFLYFEANHIIIPIPANPPINPGTSNT